jgi:hypothetical protein
MKKYVALIIFPLLFFNCVKNSQTYEILSEKVGINVLFYDYSNNELLVLDIDKNEIVKNIKINEKLEWTDRWFYDGNIYYMDSGRHYTNIYKIEENGNLIKIFEYGQWFYDFNIIDDNLYLLSYIEPSYEISNIEKNYIVKYNFDTKEETIIDFNNNLSRKMYVPRFKVLDDNAILLNSNASYISNLNDGNITFSKGFGYESNLYMYKVVEDKIELISEQINGFSVFGNSILIGGSGEYRNFTVKDIINRNEKVLPYKYEYSFSNFFYISHDYIIYADAHEKKPLIELSLFPIVRTETDYFLATTTENKKKIIYFSKKKSIKILGSYNGE